MTKTMEGNPPKQVCCAAGEISAPKGQEQAVRKTLVLLATDTLGKGDDELGRKICVNFIRNMKEMGDDLWRLVLINGAVKLAVEGSEALPQLQELAGEGVGIIVCEPCLKVFNLLEKKQVGQVIGMADIVTSMQLAEKVISLT